MARVAAEYTRVLYLAEKARADGCAIVGEVEWVSSIRYPSLCFVRAVGPLVELLAGEKTRS